MKGFYPLGKISAVAALTLGLSIAAAAQQAATPAAETAAKLEQPKPAPKTTAQPALHAVREVELGMSVDDVKKKLGKPDVQDDTGLLFSLSGGDSVQVGLDENKHVKVVAVIYSAGNKNAPSLKDVFGPTVDEATGDTYKMERYPDAGYWVSYSRTNSSDKPIVVVTMRKMS